VSRIVLNTFGSFGDLHPYLAIAIELKKRGHDPLIATSEIYRQKVEAENIAFAAVRPDIGELMNQEGFLKLLWDSKNGTKHLLRDYLLPNVSQSYEDLAKACMGADLLLTHFAAYAAPIVAEVQRLCWISIALQPTIFFSKYDPPVLAPAPWARHLYALGSWVFASMMRVGEFETRNWVTPLLDLREKFGLPRGGNPIISGQFSPYGTLALFSEHFAKPQPDWPKKTTVTGFVSYDKPGEGFGLSPRTRELERFLDAGDPPVVFTLGSSAVMAAGQFFQESIEAAKKLGVRAVLLAWKNAGLRSDDSTLVTDYAPYSELFPRAAAVVHVGGIGTVGQALRAGRPMLVVPWAHDQPDNAQRCRKLGVAQTVQRNRYRAGIVARKLNQLLTDPSYEAKAKTIAQSLAAEDGLKTACDAIEVSVSF
jgi:rhamnosyltransferase subunit B